MRFLCMFFLCLLLLGGLQAFAEDSPFDWTVTTHAGVYFGGMNEYVFEKGREQELSRLEWDENFVPFIDLSGQFNFWNFFMSVSVMTALPVRSGTMRNFDYMLGDSRVSHFSEHDALFDKHMEILPNIGWGTDIGRWYLGTSLGFLFRNRKWSATGGYTQYPQTGHPWEESLPKQNQEGVIITYEELLWAPLISLYVDYSINDNYEIGGYVSYYPYLNVSTIDTHILRKTRFHDQMQGGWGILADLSLTYHPKTSDMVSFIFGVGYEGMFPTKGSSASGQLGAGDGSDLLLDHEIQSQMSSNLFWVNIGVTIKPAKFFTAR